MNVISVRSSVRVRVMMMGGVRGGVIVSVWVWIRVRAGVRVRDRVRCPSRG